MRPSRKSPLPSKRRCCPPRPAPRRRWAARPPRPRALPGRFPRVGKLSPRARCALPPTASTPSPAIRKTLNARSTSLARGKAGRWRPTSIVGRINSPRPMANPRPAGENGKASYRGAEGLNPHGFGNLSGSGWNDGAGAGEEAQLPHAGAIVEAPEGLVFFKLTGPLNTVAAAENDFNSLLGSVHRQ